MTSRGHRMVELAKKILAINEEADNVADGDHLTSKLNDEQILVANEVERKLANDAQEVFNTRVIRPGLRERTHSVTSTFSSDDSIDLLFFGDDSDQDKSYVPECDGNVSSSGESDIVYSTPKKRSTPKKKSYSPKKYVGRKALLDSTKDIVATPQHSERPIDICFNDQAEGVQSSGSKSTFQSIDGKSGTSKEPIVDNLSSSEDIDVTKMSSGEESNKLRNRQKRSSRAIMKRTRGGIHARKRKQERKLCRNTGKAYITTKGKTVSARSPKPLKNCRLGCKNTLEVAYGSEGKSYKDHIFSEYWGLGDHDKRVAFVCGLIETAAPKVKRTRTDDPEKQKFRMVTHKFYFQINGQRIHVCKDCFVRTLGETHSFINVSLYNRTATVSGASNKDNRGSQASANKHSEEKLALVRDHINSIPKYKSHYSRRESDKNYLPGHLNMAILYEKYLEITDDPVSRKTYSDEFHKLNISFKAPQIDTCNKCGVLNNKIKVEIDLVKKQELENQLALHQEQADYAYQQKRKDKHLAKANSRCMRCYMFDLQQCLPTPCLTESVVFYKRQLWTFNMTMYDSTSSRVKCYMWHEGEGGRGGNQIATCIYKELVSLPPDVKHVILYSDTCGGQNKNSHVSAMFLTAMQDNQHLESIDHKFMISGHSHLECDINHARIEEQKKRLEMPIYSPQDWYQVVRSTGPKNNKYQVVELNHHDFFAFSSLLKHPLVLRKKDNDGNVFNWHEAKWFRYTKEYGKVMFKNSLREDEPFKILTFLRRGATMTKLEPTKCYNDQLAIPDKKKSDLTSILNLLPPSYHEFYLGLKSSAKLPEVLPDIEEFPVE